MVLVALLGRVPPSKLLPRSARLRSPASVSAVSSLSAVSSVSLSSPSSLSAVSSVSLSSPSSLSAIFALGYVRRSARVALVGAAARLGLFAAPLLVAASLGVTDGAGAWILGYGAVLAAAAAFSGAIEPRAAATVGAAFGYRRRAVRRLVRSLTARIAAASLAGTVAGAALVVGVEPAGLPLQRTLALYALFAAGIALASFGALYAGALVAAGRTGSAVGSHALRGAAALAGAAAACVAHAPWLLAVGLVAGELARAWWLRARLRAVLATTTRRSTAPVETGGRVAGALAAVALVAAAGLLSHVAYPAAALLCAGDILYSALLLRAARR